MHSPTQTQLCVAVFIFCTSAICGATMITTSAYFTKGKAVSTSHTTFQPYSIIQCAVKCFEEGRNGNCSIAGYDNALNACYLSVDAVGDVVDIADEMSGVVYMTNGETCT